MVSATTIAMMTRTSARDRTLEYGALPLPLMHETGKDSGDCLSDGIGGFSKSSAISFPDV